MQSIARVVAFLIHGVIGYFFFLYLTEWFLFTVAAMATHYALKAVFTCSPIEYVLAYPEYALAKVKYWYNRYAK